MASANNQLRASWALDYRPVLASTLEENWEAAKVAAGVCLRLHGLDEAPDDYGHPFYDDLDLFLRALGIRDELVSAVELEVEEEKESA